MLFFFQSQLLEVLKLCHAFSTYLVSQLVLIGIIHNHTMIQTKLKKVSIAPITLMLNIWYLQGHYFIQQLLAVTSYPLIYGLECNPLK